MKPLNLCIVIVSLLAVWLSPTLEAAEPDSSPGNSVEIVVNVDSNVGDPLGMMDATSIHNALRDGIEQPQRIDP